ncbi:alanine--tRNA ligase [Ereboglobus luteus]|uniref:Alanine--tRNA ligase n=1 Tax=Ereboglobus luteus TaxID=1796921 RepID=A0A2U8E6E3_9BACT|nr:alanine--tRNA ligase [Ereboglobus luteus]
MTASEIRQSFLDYFASQQHSIVASSSLMPDSPGLLFTNAGMNQFVPIFLNERKPDAAHRPNTLRPALDTRATDTQKCIRAGGKHNDLDDVGFDTYHHTMFEMLGNWSFGDYFKKESLAWGWELLTKVWGIPAKRLFATVYSPDKSKNDPADFDQEAHDIWAGLFRAAGLDPAVHIVNGNKKDNFWMMGDTGPCGPCSEIHFNLLPSDDEAAGRALVNSGSPRCIEIWNHVFIQFNAGADGSFSPLPARHVDTGMGFERVAGIYATTKAFTDFTPEPSNYNADIFTSLFEAIAKLSGKTYTGTVPATRENLSEQQRTDIAFRVLADHARTVSCAIADGILPSNEGRNYVIRRILRRGILYGRKDLGLSTGFFTKLVPAVVASLGTVFPELKEQQTLIEKVIRNEEENFGKTLDRGIALFSRAANLAHEELGKNGQQQKILHTPIIPGAVVFELYDTYGFPLDMTQLLAAEYLVTVDTAGFEKEMEAQRARARAAQKKEIITVTENDNDSATAAPTPFTGFDYTHTQYNAEPEPQTASLVEIITVSDGRACLVFDRTPFYAEMGGQVGDTGTVSINGKTYAIASTIKDKSGRHLHELANPAEASELAPSVLQSFSLSPDVVRRRAIQRHHTATHLLHWALREVLGAHVRQAGSSVNPGYLRFDFAHFEQVKPDQLRQIETLVNQRIIENATVSATEVAHADIAARKDINQFFGDKYGDRVRVVQVGGTPGKLDGYSMELCGGTHTAATGELGLFKISVESAIAAGTRRIEAVTGLHAYALASDHETLLKEIGARIQAGPQDILQKFDTLLAHKTETEKKLKLHEQRAAASLAADLAAKATGLADGLKQVTAVVEAPTPDALRSIGSQVLSKLGEGVVKLGAAFGPEKVSVVVFCSPAANKAGHQAGKLVAELCAKLDGKGGGKPDFAMGGGKAAGKLAEVLK